MYNPNEKIKLSVSSCLKSLNKIHHKNYTVQDVADYVGVSRESLSRLTTHSSFNLVYAVASCIYEFYPEHTEYWNLSTYIELLAYDNRYFLL